MSEVAIRDTVFQEVLKTESQYWSSPENRYAQFMEQIAELDVRAMLDDAEERGMKRGIEQGIEKGMEKGIEQGIEKGIEKGMEKGIEQGIEKGIEQIARTMVEKGMEIEMISQITGLSFERLKNLPLSATPTSPLNMRGT